MYQFPFAGDGFIRTRDNAWVGPENAKLLAWLDAGNTPDPAPEPPAPPAPLTTEQKLEAAGLTVAELKELFGLS